MKQFINRLRSYDEFLLRVGLGLTLLYAGFNIIGHSVNWIGYVPEWIGYFVDRNAFLTIHGIGEIVLGLGLVSGYWLPIFSGLTALDFLSILMFFGIDDITFRDFGLFAAALALFLRSLPE
ncbi:MAG: hypothetical protein HY456_02490 [Parcubacteria group bacterium]|nr:hypothetical protein [Parcubacteria group bacterium]